MVAPVNPSLAFQWDSLPSHLQELILAHLPVSEQSRLRSVNRAWLTLFTSTYFRELHRRLHPRIRPTFLVYNHAVKISALVWPQPEDEVPAAPSWQDLSLPAPFVREWVGGARSLVCVRNHLSSNAFSVGCPYSNQWKALPNPPRGPVLSKLWAMVPHTYTNAASAQYFIIVLQLNTPSLHIDVYDSEKNLWLQRTIPKGSTGKGHLVAFSSTTACVGGLVYSVQAESRSIVTYDVQSDVWKTMEAKLPENLVFQASKQGGIIQAIPQVMQGCKGKILLVGAAESASGIDTQCGDDGNDADAGAAASTDAIVHTEGRNIINYAVIVWELDWFTKQWREMARAPSHMCMHMLEEAMESCKAALTPVKFSGHAEVVIVMASGAQRALQFDALEEKWAWLDLPVAVNCDLSLCLDPESVEIF